MAICYALRFAPLELLAWHYCLVLLLEDQRSYQIESGNNP